MIHNYHQSDFASRQHVNRSDRETNAFLGLSMLLRSLGTSNHRVQWPRSVVINATNDEAELEGRVHETGSGDVPSQDRIDREKVRCDVVLDMRAS